MRRPWWLLCALALSCPSTQSLPGDEAMGTFEFHADPLSIGCSLGSLPDGGFDFEVTARHNKDGTGAWLLIGGVVGDAGFDGQYMTSVRAAPRSFEKADGGTCTLSFPDGGVGVCNSTLTETLVFALLSAEQATDAGGVCPPNALDGGVEALMAQGPHSVGASYDAVRACGTLTDSASITGDCAAECMVPCSLSYTVSGARK